MRYFRWSVAVESSLTSGERWFRAHKGLKTSLFKVRTIVAQKCWQGSWLSLIIDKWTQATFGRTKKFGCAKVWSEVPMVCDRLIRGHYGLGGSISADEGSLRQEKGDSWVWHIWECLKMHEEVSQVLPHICRDVHKIHHVPYLHLRQHHMGTV